MKSQKSRLDRELVARGLAPSRDKARALIMAGEVMVDQQCVLKSDKNVSSDTVIEIRQRYPYVSRAALKIEKAIEVFDINPRGMNVVDIGISTGGFSDFLLKRGAASIVGVDVNTDQVDYQLKQNSRLRLLKKNARYVQRSDIQMIPDLIVMDVSFISVAKIIPVLREFREARILVLVKPQFEVERSEVSRGGVIRDRSAIVRAVLRIKAVIERSGFSIRGFTPAGIKGKKGNQEYFFYLGHGKKFSFSDKMIDDEIEI
jgi:23S rRNA (cytidine1920-2'-O)/16S rRNA (cytidine1409-2'-O)-methyltransferase